ncbi:MAG: hypothetical protein N2746_04565 [Deltaproteobacteria bacterium]|nr:hypothetical protein [Deltaproteobacteria bacterium]
MKRILFSYFILIIVFACPSPNYVPTESQYSEYKCPEPIGLIIRENCRENLIKYQAEDISIGAKASAVQIATAEGSYKSETKVLQEASEFMQFLKDQQTSLCNDYNTCKLTTHEYKERKDRINKTFTTIYALTKQIRVSDLDPEIRKDILRKILAAIDEYNKPLTRQESVDRKTDFSPPPAKVKDVSSTPQRNFEDSNSGLPNQLPQDNSPDISEAIDEAGKIMIKMQNKVIDMQKKMIDMQKKFDDVDSEGGDEY